ncbi:MAG: flagellar biosynthetic protein FliR [Nitrospirae bacterium]|nr:flagellar biosynthetic protein FliR [Candidatus Manganitrophaceae bacterium]
MSWVQPLFQYETSFVLILFRVGSFLAAMPMVGGQSLPGLIKVSLALAVSLVLVPIISMPPPPSTLSAWMVGLVGEVLIGWVIGLGTQLIFAAVDLGGEIAGLQMGFGIASVIDPASNQPVPLIEQVYTLLAVLIFFGARADHLILQALVHSFGLLPPMAFAPNGIPLGHFIQLAGQMFVVGMKIAIPVTMVLLLANVALGILSRVVPQMNVWLMSFPVTIGLGLLVMGATLSLFVALLQDRMAGLEGTIASLLIEMRK